MFKKLLQLKTLLVALLVMTGAGNVWADEVTYTFTAKDWGATIGDTQANWTSGKNGGQLTQGRGIQVTTSASGANGTSPVSYSNISKIVVKYCTNADKGAGKIKVKVGDGTEQSFTVSKPSSGGTTLKNATFNFSPAETGNVKVTVNCTTNSVYIYSVTITYSSGSTTETCATPTFSPAEGTYTSAQNVTLSTTTGGATIYYTTDGTDPETSSSSYSSAIPVSATTTIKAIAVKEGMENSDVASATYTIVSLAHAGTEEDPYTVADARTAIDANVGKTGVYAKGIVSEIVTAYSSEYENITFDIVDENGTATLRAYRCSGTEAANVQVGDIVVVSGNLTTYKDIYEFEAGNQLISLNRKEAAVLESISLSGTYPTTFTEGEAFSHKGMTVTATYEDTSEKDVTASATFEGYVMATPGQQTVTVSYTEGEVTKTAAYGITVNAAPSHNVTWSVNGETTTESYKEGEVIEFPENPADVNGKTFVGWATNTIDGTTAKAPEFVTSAAMGNNDVTYYAVFAKASMDNVGWIEEKLSNMSASDVFVFSTGSYAIPNDKGTSEAPNATSITVTGDKITSDVPDNLKWNVSGNATDGYTFYPNGSTTTWLYCNTTASSSSNNNIRVGTGDRKSWVFNNSGYLVTNDNYTDRYLSLYGSQDFRGYTGTENGAFVPKFYKYVGASYSAYCTSVIDAPTASKAACEFDTPFDVTITSEEGTTLKYTTDGTEPAQGTAVDANSVVLSIPAATTRVRAIALLNGASSPELDVTYTYNSKQAPTLTVPASVDLKVNETGKTITVTTNSDGAVTFESSDDNHLLVDNTTDNKVGELLAVAEGTYTVTVTVAETANYRSATADVTVNVTKTATTLTIDATGLTNTDVYVNTAAGALAATVQQKEGGKPVAGATVTWDSSNTDVATIDANGTVTLVAEGTTTLTATYAGDDTYEGSTDKYELTVTDSNPIRSATFTFNGQYKDEHITNGITNSLVHFICGGDADRFAISPAANYKGQLAIYRKTDNTTNAGCFTISSTDDNYAIVRIELDGTNTGSLSTDVSSYDNSIWQGNSSSVTFTNNTTGTQCYISDITVLYARVTPLTVTAAGYATFSSTSALDFTNVEDIHAYTATVSDNTISFKRVKKVPANTGLLLRSVKGGAVSTSVPSLTGAAEDVAGNLFVAVSEDTSLASDDESNNNYILNNGSNGIGFYLANNKTVGAGKAYLAVPKTAGVRGFISFDFSDPATGIATIGGNAIEGTAFDLQGRRINAPKGGLYIINGKKVIVK